MTIALAPCVVQIFMTGHGGDEFIKFQDTSELMAQDLADAMAQMADKQRYRISRLSTSVMACKTCHCIGIFNL
jgi:glycosylphosphatidylinositol transamidase (GPIT) subunit GPI8